MSKLNSHKRYNRRNQGFEALPDKLDPQQDLFTEQILQNVNSTPIGQLLKKIAGLPEIREEKVLAIRGQLRQDQYDLNGRLDIALDKVLEEIIL